MPNPGVQITSLSRTFKLILQLQGGGDGLEANTRTGVLGRAKKLENEADRNLTSRIFEIRHLIQKWRCTPATAAHEVQGLQGQGQLRDRASDKLSALETGLRVSCMQGKH